MKSSSRHADELRRYQPLPGRPRCQLILNSQAALGAGITNELSSPPGVRRVSMPRSDQLRMVGTYHEFGSFISKVASLPRW